MTNWNLLSAVAWFYESVQVNFCSATRLMAVQFWFAATPYVWWSCKITPARRCSPSRNSCSSMSMGGLILSVRSSSSSSSSRNSKQDMHLLRHLIFSFAFQLVFNAGSCWPGSWNPSARTERCMATLSSHGMPPGSPSEQLWNPRTRLQSGLTLQRF